MKKGWRGRVAMRYSMRHSVNQNPSMFERAGSRIIWRLKDQTLWVEPWGRDSIRVRATTLAEMPLRDWSLSPAQAGASSKLPLINLSARLVNGRLTATVDSKVAFASLSPAARSRSAKKFLPAPITLRRAPSNPSAVATCSAAKPALPRL